MLLALKPKQETCCDQPLKIRVLCNRNVQAHPLAAIIPDNSTIRISTSRSRSTTRPALLNIGETLCLILAGIAPLPPEDAP